MRGRLAVLIAAALLTLLPVNSPGVSEAAKRCTVADLNGTYVFAATGFGTPQGGSSPTARKAIVEVISFNGDGTVDTPKVSLSVNGTVINESPGSSGTYTIDTATANGVCTGTLNFRGTATRRAH
jgi:hypothetical protein